MSDRDELATIIESQPALLTMGNDQQDRARSVEIADAILAAGYTKPRTITTDEEADALPERTVVLDKYGVANQLVCEQITEGPAERCWDTTGWDRNSSVALPATVLYEPAA